MQEYNPIAIWQQETYIDQTKEIDVRRYSTYNNYSQAINGKPIGSAAMLVRTNIPNW